MSTKLTLRLDAALIARAKAYARARGTSLSQVTADFFAALTADATEASLRTGHTADAPPPVRGDLPAWAEDLAPGVRTLLDRPGPRAPLDRDDYRAHLAAKHA